MINVTAAYVDPDTQDIRDGRNDPAFDAPHLVKIRNAHAAYMATLQAAIDDDSTSDELTTCAAEALNYAHDCHDESCISDLIDNAELFCKLSRTPEVPGYPCIREGKLAIAPGAVSGWIGVHNHNPLQEAAQ